MMVEPVSKVRALPPVIVEPVSKVRALPPVIVEPVSKVRALPPVIVEPVSKVKGAAAGDVRAGLEGDRGTLPPEMVGAGRKGERRSAAGDGAAGREGHT